MSGEAWTCKDEKQLLFCFEHLRKYWDWSSPISIKWSKGAQKSMGQNALVHVWIREITKHMNKLPGNNYDEDTVKTYLKRKYGVRFESKDLLTGESMTILKSYERYEKGEMTVHMNLIAEFAACINCTLPVWGEYQELQGMAA